MKDIKAGVISIDELKKTPGYPSDEVLDKGPTVVIECSEEIPCNPCETICKEGAIVVGEPITNLPEVLPDKCNACGRCIAICPGLAIFIVDKTYSQDKASVSFPHEYLPLPQRGDTIDATNREGRVVCKGKVVRVLNPKANDHTPVITITIPKQFANEVRGIKRLERNKVK